MSKMVSCISQKPSSTYTIANENGHNNDSLPNFLNNFFLLPCFVNDKSTKIQQLNPYITLKLKVKKDTIFKIGLATVKVFQTMTGQ